MIKKIKIQSMESLSEFLNKSIMEAFQPSPFAEAMVNSCLEFSKEVLQKIDDVKSIEFENVTIKWKDVSHLYQDFLSKAIADISANNMDKDDIKWFEQAIWKRVGKKDPTEKFKWDSRDCRLAFNNYRMYDDFANGMEADTEKIIDKLGIETTYETNSVWCKILFAFVQASWERLSKNAITNKYGSFTFLPHAGFRMSIGCSFVYPMVFTPNN